MLLFLLSIYAVMRSSILQTYLTKKATTYLSDLLNTEVKVGGVDLELFRTFVLKEVFIRDLHKDTLIYAGELKLHVKNYNLKKNNFRFKTIEISNTRFNLVQYKRESDLNFQFILDAFDTGDTSKNKSKAPSIWCSNFELKNVDFSYRYEKDTTPNFGINFNDAHVRHVNGSFTNLAFVNDTLTAHIDNLTALEKSGFQLKRFTADVSFGSIFMVYKNLDFSTNKSHVSSNQLSFDFKNWDDFNDFEEKVNMSAVFKRSIVEMEDIAYFAPELEGIHKMLTLTGDVRGTVSNLVGRKVKIAFGKNSHLHGDFNLNGLPYLKETYVHLKIDELTTNQIDLESLPTSPFTAKEYLKLPHNIARLGQVNFKGNFTGFYNDFVAYGNLATQIGSITSDIQMRQKSENSPMTYSGKLKTNNFDLGTYYGLADVMRNITLDVDINGKGLSLNNINANIVGKIASFEFQQYAYKNIDVKGTFAKNIFNGQFAVEDENVALNFDGDIDLTGKYPYLNFKTEIQHADLSNLNLFKTKNKINFSTLADVKLTGDDIDNLEGSIKLKNTHFIQNEKSVDISDALLISDLSDNNRKLQLISDFADGEIKGKFTLQELQLTLQKMIASYLPALKSQEDISKKTNQQNFVFSMLTKDSKDLSLVLFERLAIYKNTKLEGIFNSTTNDLRFQLNAPEIDLAERKLRDFEISSKTESEKLNIVLRANKLTLGDSNTVKNIILYANAAEDSLKFKMQWVNDSRLNNKGKLSGYTAFNSLNDIAIHFNPSEIFIEDSLWRINKNNLITISDSKIWFQNFELNHDKQSLKIAGLISKHSEDKLNIALTNFNLGILNPLLRDDDVQLQGTVNGTTTISDLYSNLVFSSSLTFNSFTVNNEMLGDGSVLSIWDGSKESIAINGRFLRGEIPTIGISGFYYPNKKENSLDFELSFQKTQLKLLEKYTNGVASNINGTATGDLFLSGSLKKPQLTGSLEIQKAGFKIDYINTNYTFSAKVNFKNGAIDVPPFSLYDINGNKAEVEGIVTHNYFNSIRFDFDLDAKKLFCLNTNSNQNNLYYGKAYATGLIKIYGDLKNINFNIDARTEKGTQFNIPLSGAAEISENKFVSFINKNDTAQAQNNPYQVDLAGIQLNFDLDVTPDAEVQLIFDSKIGDVIKGNGSGSIKMQINTLGQFNIYGDYIINSGDYLFTLKNVINKRFKIDQGGTVSWNGDPYDAFVNLNAVYRVRTSLFELLQEDTYKQRVPVDCELKMTDKLFNPTISFGINLPNSDERIKNEVRSAIGFENEAELNKQVFSLLVLGRFIPPTDIAKNASSTPTASTDYGVSSNSSELLSNQISNWLSQTNDLVKVGVKYSPGDEITNKELQVAVSTDLFNDRVSIDGNVGVANNPYAASNIVGDVNIEYKINKDGKFRVKAFNQSNDYTTIANNGPYKQGVGVFYREEFDTWGELIRRYREKIRSLGKTKSAERVPDTNRTDL
jgi:hypothetical protein